MFASRISSTPLVESSFSTEHSSPIKIQDGVHLFLQRSAELSLVRNAPVTGPQRKL